jgi:hypothetical protein
MDGTVPKTQIWRNGKGGPRFGRAFTTECRGHDKAVTFSADNSRLPGPVSLKYTTLERLQERLINS